MSAEDGTKRAVLKPADENLLVTGVVGIATLKAADIGRPVGKTGHREIQPSRNLPPQRIKRGRYVSIPRSRRMPLLAQKRRPRQNEHPLFVSGSPLSFIHRFCFH